MNKTTKTVLFVIGIYVVLSIIAFWAGQLEGSISTFSGLISIIGVVVFFGLNLTGILIALLLGIDIMYQWEVAMLPLLLISTLFWGSLAYLYARLKQKKS